MMPDNNFFIHTYNFVQYDKTKSPDRINPETVSRDLTGYIDCNLFVRTPLSVPDSEKREENYGRKGHTAYPFFSVSGKPVIPGSEIRGLVRNIYEIITNSCFSVINSNMISSRSIAGNDAEKEPGILYFDKDENRWVLLKANRRTAYTKTAKDKLLTSFKGKDYVERDWELSVQLSTNMQKLKERVDEAILEAKTYDEFWVILETPFGFKNDFVTYVDLEDKDFGFIFKSKLDKGNSPSERELNNKLNSVNAEKKWGPQYSVASLEDYFKLDKAKREAYYKKYYGEPVINYSLFIPLAEEKKANFELEKAVEKFSTILDFSEMYAEGDRETLARIARVRPDESKRVPVFYRFENGKVIITPSHFSREIYNNTVESILSAWKKCSDKTNLCPGCRLFGMIGAAENSYASRVRFTDAKVKDGYVLDRDYTTLKVLASPKTTGWQFYADKKFDEPGVSLKGRKMYFHNPLAASDSSVYSHSKKEKFNASVKLMRKGEFTFRIYFDNISSEELRYLILAVTLGENREDSRLMQKLGHGKPLGLGSVKITVSDVVLRNPENYSVTHTTEYIDELAAENPLRTKQDIIPAGKNTLNDLLNLCSFDFCNGFNVSYPVVEALPGVRVKDNDVASHRYFAWMRNETGFSRTSRRQYEYNVLPAVADSAEKMKLPVLVTDSKKELSKKGGQGGSGVSNGQSSSTSSQTTGERTLRCSQCGRVVENVRPDIYERYKNSRNYKCIKCLKGY